MTPKPVALIILDGYGYREESENNAILHAHTPNMDHLWQTACAGLISGSGSDVGLPDGQMGNSEVGHLNLGAGRVVYQEYTRINKAIADNLFEKNDVLCAAIDSVKQSDSALHIFGLLSPGGVHSHEDQIFAMLTMAANQGLTKVYFHAFLDGRDTPPRSAMASIEKTQALCAELGVGQLASLAGRYYAMDRDNRWERVAPVYEMLTEAKADYQFANGVDALNAAYDRDENDEFVKPTMLSGFAPIQDNDAVIFMNFRADRARELSRAFVHDQFDGFQRKVRPAFSHFVQLTSYAEDIESPIAFPPLKLDDVLGEVMAQRNKRQLRIAETEKYAHVTFFFNGGIEQPFAGEDRELIPSPQVATYDLQPEMNAPLLTDKLCAAIESQEYDLIICNYANPDMVGHTGNFDAAVKAITALDECIGRVIASIDRVGGECIITADHGNADMMLDHSTGQAHTAHTTSPVPFIYHGRDAKMTVTDGVLSDIAPTLLTLMGESIPEAMTGRVLVEFND
jgi:2,3-bisphosphoglycerate-independent phosphoglycerate mutase